MGASRLLPRSRSASSVMKRRWILSSGRTEPATGPQPRFCCALGRIGSRRPLPPSSKRPATRVRMSVSAPYGHGPEIRDVRVLSCPAPVLPGPGFPLSGLRRCGRSVRTPAENRPLLIRALGDPDAGVRREAARQVGRRRVGAAVQPLTRLFEDPDTGVRKAAARALERIGWRPVDPGEQLAYLIAKEEWEEIQRLGLLADPAREQESDKPALLPGGLQGRIRPALPEEQTLQEEPGGGYGVRRREGGCRGGARGRSGSAAFYWGAQQPGC